MKRFSILILLFVLACGNERIVQLPEISNSDISKVVDVSPAYIFYDETANDSVVFNRKNLIGTTNWLVNVDKRLSLKQALPHLQYLQNKRHKKGMHTNENAKNYFSCNDLSNKTLGFIEFTNTKFSNSNLARIDSLISSKYDGLGSENSNLDSSTVPIIPVVIRKNKVVLFGKSEFSYSELIEKLNTMAELNASVQMQLYFENSLSFQEYISFKEQINAVLTDDIQLDMEEFIF